MGPKTIQTTKHSSAFTNGATVQNIAFTSAVVKGYKQAANPGQLFVAKVF